MCLLDDKPSTSELTYISAESLAQQREAALEVALTKYFGHDQWTENDIAELNAIIEYGPVGDTFIIDGKPILHFGRIITNITIDGPAVRCSFAQTVEYVGEDHGYTVGEVHK